MLTVHEIKIREVTKGMSKEEMEVAVQEIPLEILATEVWNRMGTLAVFKAKFDGLSEVANNMEKFDSLREV